MITKTIQSNILTTEESIGILSLLKMECIHILILTVTFTSIWNKKNHHTNDSQGNKKCLININFVLSTYKVLISFSDDKFQLDLRETNFGELIGFAKKLITKTEYGTKLPNITNSIDILNINTNAIKDSIVDGVNTSTIAMIPTDNLTRSYPFTFEPRRNLYCPVSSNTISEMRIYVTDSLGRPVDFNGVDWFMTLILHSR